MVMFYFSQVEAVLKDLQGFDKSQILGYSAGSIVVDMALIFDKDSAATSSDVNAVLRTVTDEEGDLGSGLTVQLTDNAEGKEYRFLSFISK